MWQTHGKYCTECGMLEHFVKMFHLRKQMVNGIQSAILNDISVINIDPNKPDWTMHEYSKYQLGMLKNYTH